MTSPNPSDRLRALAVGRKARPSRRALLSGLLAAPLLVAAACSSTSPSNTATGATTGGTGSTGSAAPAKTFTADRPLKISAIPDQDAEKLNRLYGKVSTYLESKLGVKVEYVPVTDYAGSVSAFRIGDLDAVWFGGLTGVQARIQEPGAVYLAQRDIDAEFKSVFIANTSAGIAPLTDVSGLAAMKGKTLTFGSESSTSGRLMPQYFMDQAGVSVDNLEGQAGFSGSHDKTIAVVEAGTYQVGALNKAVWDKTVKEGKVDESKVKVIFTTPSYYDYHWLARPDLDATFGAGFTAALGDAILALDSNIAEQKEILELFSAKKFIQTKAENYAKIEEIGGKIGLIK